MEILEIKEKYQKLKGKKEQTVQDITLLKSQIKSNEKHNINLVKAKEIIRIVGLQMQQQLEFHISDVTSLALESVFKNPYKVKLAFVERRGKTECDIFFERNGVRMKPIGSSGVGAIDIAAFALRVAAWSMQTPRKRNVIILDEPFKHLSENNQEAASEMIKQISQKLNIQFIIVTHCQVLAAYADKVFKTRIKKGITKIR